MKRIILTTFVIVVDLMLPVLALRQALWLSQQPHKKI